MIPSGNGCFTPQVFFLLLLLQGLVLDHISLLHVHPYLPPVMVAVLAMFEEPTAAWAWRWPWVCCLI